MIINPWGKQYARQKKNGKVEHFFKKKKFISKKDYDILKEKKKKNN